MEEKNNEIDNNLNDKFNIQGVDDGEEEKKEKEKINIEETEPLKDSNNQEMSEEEKEKQYLIKILHKIEAQLNREENKNKDLANVYGEIMNKEEEEDKSSIRKEFDLKWDSKKYRCLLHFMFLFLLPIFTSVNLVGIFQILSIMNVLYEACWKSIICYFGFESEEEDYQFYNFYGYYIKEALDEGFDFDLMATMAFLGALLYKYSGFIYSSSFFLAINIISITLLITFYNEYKETNERYNLGKIIYLGICYILLFIGAGSSALFSQNILKDSYFKYREFLKKKNEKKEEEKDDEIDVLPEEYQTEKKEEAEEDKNSSVYFFLICITSIFGFLGKYALNIVISNQKYNFDSQYNITDIIEKNITNLTEDEMKILTDAHNAIFNHDRILFCITFGIYCFFIILSLILFSCFNCIFEKEQNVKTETLDTTRICRLCGYTIYSNQFSNSELDEDKTEQNKEEENEEVKKGICTTIKLICNCFVYCLCKFWEWIKLFIYSIKNCCDEIICGYFCCGKKNAKCCCCVCLGDLDEKEYGIQERCFCYCYQGQRKLRWFNKLIRNETQKKLMPIMIQFFILQLTTIAFEKMYDDLNEDEYNNFEEFNNAIFHIGFFVGTLILFFYLSISFGTLFNHLKNDQFFVEIKGLVETVSNEILNGQYGILIFNAFYSLYISINFLLKGTDAEDNSIKKYILVPVFMNKFYFFTFTNVASLYTDGEEGIELISFSTLISIYLSIWDFIIGSITDNIPINGLLIIQIAFSSLVVLVTIVVIIVVLFCLPFFWFALCYMLSFICFFTCGGLWFCKCFQKRNFYETACCKCCNKKNTLSRKCFEKLSKCIGEKNMQKLKGVS